MYTPDGYMSAQLMRRGRSNFASGDWFRGSPERRVSRSTRSRVCNPCRDSLAVLARVQRYPRQRAVGETLRHQAGGPDQPRWSVRGRMEERLKNLHATPQWAEACPVLRTTAKR